MLTNIEVKSLLKTDEYDEAIENAKKIYNGTDTFDLYQKDVFFNTTNGTRLKLRSEKAIETGGTSAVLISYERPNVIGPKASQYFKTAVPDSEALNETEMERFYSDDKLDDGNEFADYLTQHFGIKEKNLVAGAYMDLILEEEIKAKGPISTESWSDVKELAEKRARDTAQESVDRIEREIAEASAKRREQEAAETLATIIKNETAENPKRSRITN